MNNDILISIENVSKKFCRSFRRSLMYGMIDLASEVTGLRKERHTLRKQEFWALKDVSFDVKRGEVLGLIGPNGAGKTTILRMLNGLIKPDEGKVTMRGRVGALIELGAGFNPILTGKENIHVNAAILGIPKKEIDQKLDEIIDFAEIGDFIDAPVQSYSSGMRVRLGFSVAIHTNPDIMLIDEVLAVGDLAFRNKCLEAIRRIRTSGVAFIFISHNLGQIQLLCDRGLFLKAGRIVEIGSTESAISAYATQSFDDNDFRSAMGSGDDISIRDVRMIDDNGESVEEIISVRPITFRVTFEAKIHLESPLFHFMFSPHGEQIVAANLCQRRDEERPSFPPGVHTMDISIGWFSLLAGRYQMKLTISGADLLTKYARDYQLGSVNVVMRNGQFLDTNRSGFIEMEGRWSVVSATSPVTSGRVES